MGAHLSQHAYIPTAQAELIISMCLFAQLRQRGICI